MESGRERARRSLSAPARADSRAVAAQRPGGDPGAACAPPRASARRAAHAHVEGRHDRADRRARGAGARSRGRVVHTFHGHVLSGYFSRGASASSGSSSGRSRTPPTRSSRSASEVRDDLVRFRVAPREKIAVDPVRVRPRRSVDSSRAHAGARSARRSALDGRRSSIGWAGRLTADQAARSTWSVSLALRARTRRSSSPATASCADDVEALARDARRRRARALPRLRRGHRRRGTRRSTPSSSPRPTRGRRSRRSRRSRPGCPSSRRRRRHAHGRRRRRDGVPRAESATSTRSPRTCAAARRSRRCARDSGAHGAERMRERFSTERMVDDIERLYARVLAR